MLAKQAAHTVEALKLLLAQMKDKPKIAAFLSSWIAQVQAIEDTLFDLLEDRTIETAIGAQLDGIGSIVNLPRGGLSDAAYRAQLRIRFAVMSSSGTAEDLLHILDLASVGGTLKIEDGAIAEFTIENFGNQISDDSAAVFASYLSGARAAGVYAYFVYETKLEAAGDFFSYGPDPDLNGDSFGFDDGGFVGATEI